MEKINFLDKSQILGDEQLEIFKEYGVKATLTDFAILLGGVVKDDEDSKEELLSERPGFYWASRVETNESRVIVVGCEGMMFWDYPFSRENSARVVIENFNQREVTRTEFVDGILEVEYKGYEYPQTAVSDKLNEILEELYNNSKLFVTGKSYVTDSEYSSVEDEFVPQSNIEYEYEGKRYVRVGAKPYVDTFFLSNGKEYSRGNYVWVEVEPIIWLLDEPTGTLVSKKCLFSGIKFSSKITHYTISDFVENHFSKDIIPNTEIKLISKVPLISNPHNFIFQKPSEEEIMKGAVESGVSVFIHGSSSEKSIIIKKIDPECEIIYLRTATQESLNGKSIYVEKTKEVIDVEPVWLKRLKEKCTKEPYKKHILFFDEVNGAFPSVQASAFNIILSGEVNGIWKLPENCVIVLSGEMEENQQFKSIYNKVAHVNIEVTADEWLKWAASASEEEKIKYGMEDNIVKEYKIHPAIYAFMAYKKEAALITEYTGDKPNASPSSWELASKMLYKTKNPLMLVSILGEKVAKDFYMFCNQRIITMENVLEESCNETEVLNMSVSKKWGVVAALSYINESYIEKTRDFIIRLGEEYLTAFDLLWINGDPKKLEIITKLKENSNSIKLKRDI